MRDFDAELVDVRLRSAMHQRFVHSYTLTCAVCLDLYATEEQLIEQQLIDEHLVHQGSAA